MCDFGQHDKEHRDFGFLVDVPAIRTLISETQQLTSTIADTTERVDAVRPAFAKLLADNHWLPKEYGEPDLNSGMA